jgi:16S rRNA (cytosine967-C5)-methyltransferase
MSSCVASRWQGSHSVSSATPRLNARQAAIILLDGVLEQRRSLATLLPPLLEGCQSLERPLLQELAYGALRWLSPLVWLRNQLLERPLAPRDSDLGHLLLIGLYQLRHLDLAPALAVDATVATCQRIGKGWAKGVVNAVLRRYLREREALEAAIAANGELAAAHPRWLLQAIQSAWPLAWQEVVATNNQRPPMTLRVNQRRWSRDVALAALAAQGIAAIPHPAVASGVILAKPQAVEALPEFATGAFSVQDGAAQLAALLLAPTDGMRILDACAAPGGKSGHLLEICRPRQLVAIDSDATRLERVATNLARIGASAQLIAADAADPAGWWDGEPFDAILLDAPCSATGVVRRHPDIKWLRRRDDIAALAAQQALMLDRLWPLLAVGGRLLYATCSILPAENHEVVAAFLARTADAVAQPITAEWGIVSGHGRQIVPTAQLDGFFYAQLNKVG